MLKALAIAIGLLSAMPSSMAQVPMTKAGLGAPKVTASYTGPGDIKSGAVFWAGLRGYSAAYASPGTNKAINITRASDSTSTDIVILSNGNLDVATASTFCNATTCVLNTAYDQTGNGNNFISTTTFRPQLIFNCIGSLPCIQFTGSTFMWINSTIGTTAQPETLTSVAIRTADFTTYQNILGTVGQPQIAFGDLANQIDLYAGTLLIGTANDNVWHAVVGLFNGSSSVINIDGTETSGNAGTTSGGTTPGWGVTGDSFNEPQFGEGTENGYWASTSSSGTRTSLCHNMGNYWGVSITC